MAQTDILTNGHGNSMTESAQLGLFSQNWLFREMVVSKTLTKLTQQKGKGVQKMLT